MFDVGKPKKEILRPVKNFFKKFFNLRNFRIKKESKRQNFFKYSLIFVVLLLFIIFIANFITYFSQSRIAYQEAVLGRGYLKDALEFIKQDEFKKSSAASSEAETHFQNSLAILRKIKKRFFISHIKYFNSFASDCESVISSGVTLSHITKQGVILGEGLENLLGKDKKLSLSKFSAQEKNKILSFLRGALPEIEKIKYELNEANENLKKINYEGLLILYKNDIEEIKFKVEKSNEVLEKAFPIFKILPPFLGYPDQANFLVLLENSDELRPTGGFLGTFSIIEVKDGEILNSQTRDIYHLDMPVRNDLNIEPPWEFKRYLGTKKWFMRDANWSPDWPSSAKEIEWFFKRENDILKTSPDRIPFDGEFSGIIGITPEIISDLLTITGPISVENVEYNKKNFVDLLQYRVEKGYVQLGVPSWHRKEVIDALYQEMKIKLFDLPMEKWGDLVNIINENLTQKNILVFFKDEELENVILEQGFGGEVKANEGDYLMVVDANMAAYKTDAVMDKRIDYSLTQNADGITAKLKVDYKHNGDFNWKTTRYRTYTRIYVPLGSQLLKSEGIPFDEVKVYDELGKTCFAVFISIEPGAKKSFILEYALSNQIADKISHGNSYSLYVQKQPGNKIRELALNLDFIKDIRTYGLNGPCAGNGRQVKLTTDLNKDKELKVEF